MKVNTKIIAVLGFFALLNIGCAEDSDIQLNNYNSIYFRDDFSSVTVDGTIFLKEGWTNFNEAGRKKWTGELFRGNGSVAFSPFERNQSLQDAVNIGWLISPSINMDLHEGEKMSFQSQKAFLESRNNTLEFFVSSNFDGINVKQATWIKIPFKTPTPDDEDYSNINSGEIDLSKYKGTLHFAFKVVGSGTDRDLDGTYQIDNITVYYPSKIK